MPSLASEMVEKVLGKVVLDRDVFDEICRLVCPHCRKPKPGLRYRDATGEWVHDATRTVVGGVAIDHSICWATGFRKSRFAELVKNG